MSKQLNFRFPAPSDIKNYSRVLSNKEKWALNIAIVVFIISITYWAFSYYISSTKEVADYGGEYTEGIVGTPKYINPLFSEANEADDTLGQLIFSSLFKYDAGGNLTNDLAQEINVSDDGTLYTVKIKSDVKWHDNQPLTANDVDFTVKLIQDPAYQSTLRGDWQGIQSSVEDDHTITFRLENAYSPFPNKLTFGILPKHIFEEVSATNFLNDEFNKEPIGSGPFIYSTNKKDSEGNIISYQLLANQDYFDGKPFLDKINFNFYPGEEELINAYNKKEINGFGAISYSNIQQFQDKKDTKVIKMNTPRYFAVFFNQTKSKPLADLEVRKALSYATDRQSLIDQVFGDSAQIVYSPILPSFGQFSSTDDYEKYIFDKDKAEQILDEDGWKKGDDGFRTKDDQPLEISLITTKWPDLAKTGQILKNQWEQIGAKVLVTELSAADIKQNFIQPREYQALLFGQEYVGNEPDPYYFWHSSGKKDPGNNIALYENSDVDKLVQEVRQTQNLDERKTKFAEFQKLISNDAPAVFLYSPNYVYVVNEKIKGIESTAVINSSYRFANAAKWYIKTKRTKK